MAGRHDPRTGDPPSAHGGRQATRHVPAHDEDIRSAGNSARLVQFPLHPARDIPPGALRAGGPAREPCDKLGIWLCGMAIVNAVHIGGKHDAAHR